MKNNRFEIIENPKCEKLTNKELRSIRGGLCLSCLKHAKKVRINVTFEGSHTASV